MVPLLRWVYGCCVFRCLSCQSWENNHSVLKLHTLLRFQRNRDTKFNNGDCVLIFFTRLVSVCWGVPVVSWVNLATQTHTYTHTHARTDSCVWNLIPVWLDQICRHQGWWCWQTHHWAPLLFFIQAFATILFYALLSKNKLQKKLDLDYEINYRYVWGRVIFFFPLEVCSSLLNKIISFVILLQIIKYQFRSLLVNIIFGECHLFLWVFCEFTLLFSKTYFS